MYPACSNTALVNTQAEALRASYTSVQDDIRRFEHAVREEAVQTMPSCFLASLAYLLLSFLGGL